MQKWQNLPNKYEHTTRTKYNSMQKMCPRRWKNYPWNTPLKTGPSKTNEEKPKQTCMWLRYCKGLFKNKNLDRLLLIQLQEQEPGKKSYATCCHIWRREWLMETLKLFDEKLLKNWFIKERTNYRIIAVTLHHKRATEVILIKLNFGRTSGIRARQRRKRTHPKHPPTHQKIPRVLCPIVPLFCAL